MLPVFADPFSNSLVSVLSTGVLALLTAMIFRILIQMQGTGTEKMKVIADQVRAGAMAFLKREYKVIGIFVVLIAACIFVFRDKWPLYPGDRIAFAAVPYWFLLPSDYLLNPKLSAPRPLRSAQTSEAKLHFFLCRYPAKRSRYRRLRTAHGTQGFHGAPAPFS